MNRNQKIDVLNGLREGRLSLADLHSSGPWILDEDIPGGVLNCSSGQAITREQFEKKEAAGLIRGVVIDWVNRPS